MKAKIVRAAASACLALLPVGCGSVNVWPFDSEKGQVQSRIPANATAYLCEGGKRFYVRYPEGGASAWVILAEREFRLDKVASDSGARYSNGKATLDTSAGQTALEDGPAVQFTACKTIAG